MAVISLVGAMLFDSGASYDMKLIVVAAGVPLLTDLGLAQLGIHEQLEPGPVDIRPERIEQAQAAAASAGH